jgi:hypothetical protein
MPKLIEVENETKLGFIVFQKVVIGFRNFDTAEV